MTERVHQAYPVPINIADAAGITRLHLASRAGNLEAVRRLLHSGADPNTATEDGVTPPGPGQKSAPSGYCPTTGRKRRDRRSDRRF